MESDSRVCNTFIFQATTTTHTLTQIYKFFAIYCLLLAIVAAFIALFFITFSILTKSVFHFS